MQENKIVADTVVFWETRGIAMSTEDASEAARNIAEFFSLLENWAKANDAAIKQLPGEAA